MFSSVFRIQARTLSVLRDIAKTQIAQSSSRPFRRIPILRPFSTTPQHVTDLSNVIAGEDNLKDAGSIDRRTLFVGRLPRGVGRWKLREKLRELFQPFGRVTSVRVATDSEGKPRQFAHIKFEKEKDALAAFQSAHREPISMMDSHLNVDMAQGVRKDVINTSRKLHLRGYSGDERSLRKASGTSVETTARSPPDEPSLPQLPLPHSHESTKHPKVDQQDPLVRQLFVGSLPSWLPEHELHDRLTEMFKRFGEIKWLKIGYGRNAHKDVVPFCHVEYVKSEDALAAYRTSVRDPMQIMNHFIVVELKKPPKPSNVLYFHDYIGSKTSFWDTVRDFESTIKRIVFFHDSSGGLSGNGYIDFKTLEYASAALPQIHGRVAKNGSRILVSYSRPRRSSVTEDRDVTNGFVSPQWGNMPSDKVIERKEGGNYSQRGSGKGGLIATLERVLSSTRDPMQ